MTEIRCNKCNKLLGRAMLCIGEIKCTRCGETNSIKLQFGDNSAEAQNLSMYEDEEFKYTVRLDFDRLSNENKDHGLKIAEELLHICGLVKQWEEPRDRYIIFYLKEMPQDVPQAGVYWVKHQLLVNKPMSWTY